MTFTAANPCSSAPQPRRFSQVLRSIGGATGVAIALACALSSFAGGRQARADTLQTSFGTVEVTPMVTGLNAPWSFAFLPEDGLLITERDGGRLLHVDSDGLSRAISGVPDVVSDGQGGLLDVMLPKDFAQTRQVYLTLATRQGRGAGTALARGVLSADGAALEGTKILFEMAEGTRGGRHFGSRVVEGSDGLLYLTIGDRGQGPNAQNLGVEAGSVVRLTRDGTIPGDNPFTAQAGARPGIYSYGHRNPQGAAVDAQGRVWVVEHGAQGGDEVNLIRKGANFGWPVISYGVNYNGSKIGEGTARAGMQQPAHFWDPSIAPSGMMIYSGRMFPEWRGDIFVGSLKFDMISRLDVTGGTNVAEAERISGDATWRVRDIREAPDGSIWFLSVGNAALYRISR